MGRHIRCAQDALAVFCSRQRRKPRSYVRWRNIHGQRDAYGTRQICREYVRQRGNAKQFAVCRNPKPVSVWRDMHIRSGIES